MYKFDSDTGSDSASLYTTDLLSLVDMWQNHSINWQVIQSLIKLVTLITCQHMITH